MNKIVKFTNRKIRKKAVYAELKVFGSGEIQVTVLGTNNERNRELLIAALTELKMAVEARSKNSR
jgi:hypothetical protein